MGKSKGKRYMLAEKSQTYFDRFNVVNGWDMREESETLFVAEGSGMRNFWKIEQPSAL